VPRKPGASKVEFSADKYHFIYTFYLLNLSFLYENVIFSSSLILLFYLIFTTQLTLFILGLSKMQICI